MVLKISLSAAVQALLQANTPNSTAVRLLELNAKHTKRVSKAGMILIKYKEIKVNYRQP